jgi:hypothetical protein
MIVRKYAVIGTRFFPGQNQINIIRGKDIAEQIILKELETICEMSSDICTQVLRALLIGQIWREA